MDILIEVLREIGRVTRKEMLVQINVMQNSRPSLATRVSRLLGQRPIAGALRLDDSNAKAGTRSYSEQELADAVSAAGLHIRSIVPPHRPLKKKPGSNTHRLGLNFYVLSKDA